MITAHLTGYLGADAEVKGTEKKFISFRVGVFDPFKKEGDPAEWVDCTMSIKKESEGEPALLKVLKKGSAVHIVGLPRARGWKKENTNEYVTQLSIYCDDIEVLSIPKA